MKQVPLVVAVGIVWLGSVSIAAQTPRQPKPTPSTQSVETVLQKELADTQAKVKELETSLTNLMVEHFRLLERVDQYSYAILDATKTAFQRVDSSTGSFLVSVDLAERYLNGYKLKLRIGNTSSVTYNGFTMSFRWGRQWDSKQLYQPWLQSLNNESITFVDILRPGAWNIVDVVLAPASENDLAYLRASISTSALSLRTP